ncbi:MAG: glycosyltransferase family 2 protein [Acidimicrobiia bacterium]
MNRGGAVRLVGRGARLAALATVAVRSVRALRPVAPLTASAVVGPATPSAISIDTPSISVIIPARNERERIGPLLSSLQGCGHQVIVVDDESSDGTAEYARSMGAEVVPGQPLPSGWVGKVWALEQGRRAAHGDWLVTFDADTAPLPGLARALVERAQDDGLDLVSVGGRFRCQGEVLTMVHASMLTTLVYRFGPVGVRWAAPARRVIANGQCMAMRREMLADAGGFAAVRSHLTDDIALVRHLAGRGWRTAMLDGSDVLTVTMHTSAPDAWRNWGRSLPMPDVTRWPDQAADLAVVWLAQGLPLVRLLTGRGDGVDLALLAARAGILAGTAKAYERRGVGYWLSPLADLPVAARITAAAIRPERTWRGRTYPA